MNLFQSVWHQNLNPRARLQAIEAARATARDLKAAIEAAMAKLGKTLGGSSD